MYIVMHCFLLEKYLHLCRTIVTCMKKLILCIILLFLLPGSRLFASMRFISVEDGLLNNSIHLIYQDRRNQMWVGTDCGLGRVTGADVKMFTQSFQKKNSLPDNYITAMYEDSFGNFWIGTLSGLYKYDYRTEQFTSSFKDLYQYLAHSKISCIEEDKNGFVWIVLSDRGLVRIQPKDNTVILYELPDVKSMDITTLFVADNGDLWLGSKYNGIAIFHPETAVLENINNLSDSNHILAEHSIFSLCTDNKGNILVAALGYGLIYIDPVTRLVRPLKGCDRIPEARLSVCLIKDRKQRIWVGTDGGGLWLLDEEKETLIPYGIQNFGFNPMTGKVQALCEDRQGNIWVGYVEKGIVVIPAEEDGFRIIENNPYSELDITDQSVGALWIDREQKLWVGTNGGGLFKLCYVNNQYKVEQRILPEENVITSLFQDSRGLMYIGTYLHGFYIYNTRTGDIRHYYYKEGGKSQLNCNHVTSFAEDHEGHVWIATNGGGVNRMDHTTGQFSYFRQTGDDTDSYLLSNWCNFVYIDSNNRLWVGTYAGLSCMDVESNTICYYTGKDSLIQNNTAIAILEDKDNNIWIGTNWGLNKIDKDLKKGSLYTIQDGLPDNLIAGFELDSSGNFWVSTNSGIAVYQKEQDRFIGYGTYDGITNQEFKLQASTHSQSGCLYFGGTRGITWFDPDKLARETPLSGLLLSGLFVFNDKIEVGQAYQGKILLNEVLSETQEITLNYRQNNLSIVFNALEAVSPERVRYEYMLEGLDRDWQNAIRGNRTAIYTNLPPGSYMFRVKAYTVPENEQTVCLSIVITPPWWLTWWAKSLYAMLTLLFLYGIFRLTMIRLREKQRMLEKEHNERLVQSKLQFFTDISHEIRTPLTLVISPLLKLIQEDTDSSRQVVYHIMNRNANRILRLINQLLDIRKIDRGQMKLAVRKTDVVSFVNDVVDSFSPLGKDKDIQLSFISEQIPDTVWIDIDFMDKIIYNLLSNAFKFTNKGGKIEIHLSVSENMYLEFTVQDNGKGISPEYIHTIFERFYQVDQRNNVGNIGTGIGLHLCRMLVELHHGTIDVSSVPGEGSVFTVRVPFLRENYQSEELCDTPLNESCNVPIESMNIQIDAWDKNEADSVSKNNRLSRKPTILLVEDNLDILALLRNELQEHFLIREAMDGKAGYEVAASSYPDLIITDVMMPVMDGLEMTQRLRGNNNTRQIPIIMLTAKTTLDDSVEGLKSGADVYISKPFDLRYLLANIINLLNRQAFAKAGEKTDHTSETTDFNVKSADDKLMEKLNRIIREHISDSSLSIESLSAELGISRVHLHRKLKEICRLTPSTYLRNVRLEYAAQLLRTKKISISEVAYAVGFGSHQYFSNCFKDFYGLSPAEYAEKYREA